jgi:hypothetical protein
MDNTIRNEGFGHWVIQAYQPDSSMSRLGPFVGELLVDSKLYTVCKALDSSEGKSFVTSIVVPSQNVAYVINEDPVLNQ